MGLPARIASDSHLNGPCTLIELLNFDFYCLNSNRKLMFFLFFSIANGSVPPTVLLSLINEHLIKDEIALDFLLEVCLTFKAEKGLNTLVQMLKKGNVESR